MEQNIKLFHQSIGNELDVVKNRVRNLIGNKHWGEEGAYKEAILKKSIQNHLPSQFKIGTGFIVGNNGEITTQIDLIIFERSYPVLFQEGDFVILNADGVRGIIEVKTKLHSGSNLKSAFVKSSKNAAIILSSHNDRTFSFFNGIFSYATDLSQSDSIYNSILEAAIEFKEEYNHFTNFNVDSFLVNHLVLNQNDFVKLFDLGRESCNFRLYNLQELSNSYFIFNLMHNLKPDISLNTIKHMFPLDSKEVNLIKSYYINS